jgi:raffinose/stachyose/melibiose transport system permease protein
MEKALKKWFPVFVIPTLAAFCVGFIWPFAQGIYLSFCQFITVSNAKWVGVSNYVKALSDTTFGDSFWFTVVFAFVSTILINGIAFAIALALTKEMKGTNIFRTVFFMPNLIGGIVLGYIWQILLNCVLSNVAQPLLALNSTAGFWGIIILMCWQQIGYMMIIYVAGLQNVPPDLLEAASIDGANAIQTLIKVKLPMLMSSFTICLFLTITNSFKLFDQNLALTGGAPSVMLENTKVNMTELLALNIFSTYNINKNYHGAAQAKAVVFFILVAVLALAQQRATRSKEVQQ